jgi:pyridoxal biosynthesis lyase PdxS
MKTARGMIKPPDAQFKGRLIMDVVNPEQAKIPKQPVPVL